MESRLACLLTVLAVAITTLVGIGIAISPALAAALALVSLLALTAWLGLSWRMTEGHEGVVGPCLLAIVMVTVLATCRYLTGVVPMLAGPLNPFFTSGFPTTDATWFVVFVVAPVSLMLLGANYLVRRSPLGVFMAWFTALYAIADGVLQFAPQWMAAASHSGLYFASALVALAEIAAGAAICQRLLRPRAAPAPALTAGALTLRQRNLWTLLFISLVAVYAVTVMRQAGPLPLGIIVGSMVGGMVGWRLTTALRPADPAWAVPMYLLMLTFFFVHVGEEALTSFSQGISAISGTPWSERDFTVLIGLVGPVVWFFSVWSLWKRQPLGNFVFWFFIVGMILGEPTHYLVFPTMAMKKFGIGYEYFSAMYTALFPMIPAIISLVTIVREHRTWRAQVAS